MSPNQRTAWRSKDDHKILSLRNRGLWPVEIASILGIRVQSVRYRLERLGKERFTFPPPTGPRPIPHRKVTDDNLLTLARSGFQSDSLSKLELRFLPEHQALAHVVGMQPEGLADAFKRRKDPRRLFLKFR
jgi:hypothetical protein